MLRSKFAQRGVVASALPTSALSTLQSGTSVMTCESDQPYQHMADVPQPLADEGLLPPHGLMRKYTPGLPGGATVLTLACISVFMTGGVIFGMSALYPVLYAEGVLVDSCTAAQQAACAAERSSSKCCDEQMLQYTLMTSVAMLPSDALVALYGELVDRIGPRKVYCMGQLTFTIGLALFVFNARGTYHIAWMWYVNLRAQPRCRLCAAEPRRFDCAGTRASSCLARRARASSSPSSSSARSTRTSARSSPPSQQRPSTAQPFASSSCSSCVHGGRTRARTLAARCSAALSAPHHARCSAARCAAPCSARSAATERGHPCAQLP